MEPGGIIGSELSDKFATKFMWVFRYSPYLVFGTLIPIFITWVVPMIVPSVSRQDLKQLLHIETAILLAFLAFFICFVALELGKIYHRAEVEKARIEKEKNDSELDAKKEIRKMELEFEDKKDKRRHVEELERIKKED